MASLAIDAELNRSDDGSYSIIEQLADAIRIGDDVLVSPEDRARLVQDLYEGPRKCQCCVNWVDEVPADVDLDATEHEPISHPLIVRRCVLPGEAKATVSIHSVEIRDPAVREVLTGVFKNFDGIVPEVKYLVFLAPFKQFFWRWEQFEKAIEEQAEKDVKLILLQLRAIIMPELAGAFAVSKELIGYGLINYKYQWTLFPPGELIYSSLVEGDHHRLFVLTACYSQRHYIQLACLSVDCDGHNFGYVQSSFELPFFEGTKKITELRVYPAKYHPDLLSVQAICLERGRKFETLVGVKYMAYRPKNDTQVRDHDRREGAEELSSTAVATKQQRLDRRVIIDAGGNPVFRHILQPLTKADTIDKLAFRTCLITQAPLDATPPNGHRPLEQIEILEQGGNRVIKGTRPVVRDRDYFDNENSYGRPPPPGVHPRHRSRPRAPIRVAHSGAHRFRRNASVDRVRDHIRLNDEDEEECKLSDFHLQLLPPRINGYCLKEKTWRVFDLSRIVDIEWNTAPFESLILPDGYKDLILSFVESQLRDGDAFDDVINGKGGGLVILLAGDPGVGKTLTAESVAEKMKAPLYKMDLGRIIDDSDDVAVNDDLYTEPEYGSPSPRITSHENEIVTAFDLAAKWKAVLLIDECDLYLEKRSDASPKRNRIVSRFLQELEYYPSLLILTTNREKALDPAIHSRIHLTINYPTLDVPSRRAIWRIFLEREGSLVTEEELDVLSEIDINGRRIRNVVKTARIMAKQRGGSIVFADIKKVMRITEGMDI